MADTPKKLTGFALDKKRASAAGTKARMSKSPVDRHKQAQKASLARWGKKSKEGE